MRLSIRRLASAVCVGAAIAVMCDALMQLTLAAVRIDANRTLSWWTNVRLIERSVLAAAAAIVWIAAPALGDWLEDVVPAGSGTPLPLHAALRLVGAGTIGLPFLWVLATWTVWAVKLTVAGTWPTEGRVFLEPSYYSGLVVGHAPQMLSGAILVALARHWPAPSHADA